MRGGRYARPKGAYMKYPWIRFQPTQTSSVITRKLKELEVWHDAKLIIIVSDNETYHLPKFETLEAVKAAEDVVLRGLEEDINLINLNQALMSVL